MDIVTHAAIGLISASPFLETKPELGLGLVAGAVLPDLDALSRIFGKKSFLRAHQTWTHAFIVQLAGSAMAGALTALLGLNGMLLGIGLLVGLAGHTLLDFANTLGVKLLLPVSKNRFCLEWVFFIDAMVLTAAVVALLFCGRAWMTGREVAGLPALTFFSFMLLYFLSKGFLRRAASKLVPANSLIPSASLPWRFFAACRENKVVKLMRLNAITGKKTTLLEQPIWDGEFTEALKNISEFQIMLEFSPLYHVVRAVSDQKGAYLLCRDLRTRNFGTSFGDLEVWLDADGRIIRKKFHV